ncbi:MAG: hypothetical protein Q9195_002007 [Heterodermia aff. obscurata]
MQLQLTTSALALIAPFFALTKCHPLGLPPHALNYSYSSTLSMNQILAIAPKSSTCEGAPYPQQCRTAEQALPHIVGSFQKYGVNSAAEQATLIAIMAFETGDFKYNVNVVPGTPGQGTRNMQSASYNMKYAMSIPSLSAELASVMTGPQGLDNPNGIRDLLTSDDDLDFGSAAWYLKTQCGPAVGQNLASGGLAAWQAYITGCVQTTPTEERQAYYERAMKALGAA